MLGGKRRSFYGRTGAAARAAAQKASADYEEGLDLDAARITVERWLLRWLERHVKLKRRPNTYVLYEQSVRTHIIPAIGSVRLDRLRPAHIEQLLAEVAGKGLAPRTVGRIQAVLGTALQHAIRQQVLSRNVAWLVEPVPVEKTEVQHLQREQIRGLLAAAASEPLGAIYILTLALGLRHGEVLGLRWFDARQPELGGVDLENRLLYVQVQLQHGQLVPLKRPRSRRVLELSPWLQQLLARHAEQLKTVRSLAGHRWQENGLVFPTSIGTPQRVANAHRGWKRFLARHGLEDVKFHILRHTAASLMIEAGIDLFKVSRTLGHTSIRTTADIYGHLTDEGRREVSERMQRVLISAVAETTEVKLQSALPPERPNGADSDLETDPVATAWGT